MTVANLPIALVTSSLFTRHSLQPGILSFLPQLWLIEGQYLLIILPTRSFLARDDELGKGR